MKKSQLDALRADFEASYEHKINSLHRVWRTIMAEYKMDNFWQIWSYVYENTQLDPEMNSALESDGRVGILNVLCRKAAALMNMRNPAFLVEEGQPGNEAIAWLLESAVDDLQRITKLTPKGKELVLEAVLTGTGPVKLGYNSEYVYGQSPWAGKISRSAVDVQTDNELPYGPTTEYHDAELLLGNPNLIVPRPQQIFFDSGARSMKEVRLIHYVFERPVVDIYRDERYSSARNQIWGEIPESNDERYYETINLERSEYHRKARLVETFSLVSRQYCVWPFENSVEQALIDWTDFELDIPSPYRFFQPIRDPEGLWGIPFAFLLLPQCRAVNQIRAKILDSIARDAKRVRLYDSELFDDEKVTAISMARDNEGVRVRWPDNEEDTIDRHMTTIEFGGVNPQLLSLKNEFHNDVNFMSGLTAATRGDANPGSDQTATEVAVRQEQQGVMMDAMREDYEGFLEELMGDLCRLMLQFWPTEKMLKIVGDDPRVFFWVPLERDRLLGSMFTLRIVVGSTEKIDKVTYRRQWNETLDRILPIADRVEQDAMRQMQAQQPPQPGMPAPPVFQSPVNWNEILRITVEQFDPSIARKILRRRDPVEIMMRLIEQHGMMPERASRELIDQAVARYQQRVPMAQLLPPPQQSYVGNLQETGQVGAPSMPQQGWFPQQGPASVMGRQLSEGVGI